MPDSPIEQDGAAFLNTIHPVSRETIRAFERYREFLVRWQAKTNLVAPSTLQSFLERHVADSLQFLAIRPECRRWTDLGSGGGFPGMVLAIVLAETVQLPGGAVNVHLVESNQKKCAFLRQVSNATGACATIHCTRIESAAEQMRDCDVLTARALAPLDRLLEWTAPFLGGHRVGLFAKGRDYQREIEECRGRWQFDLIEHPSRIDPQSRILEVSGVTRL